MSQVASRREANGVGPASFLIECGYYAVLFYAILGQALGIIFPFLGAGMLAGLAILCVMHFGARSRDLYGPIALALACVISTLLLQVFLHEESLMDGQIRAYLTWGLSLIVIQTLYLRNGFFHRFAIFAFFLGCATLPWLQTYGSTDELTRMGVSQDVGLANPNSFGMWFGFCSVYFFILGLETRNYIVRLASWSAGLLALFLVAITVSRTPLFGAAIASLIAFQKVLKRSFLPILMLFFCVWILYMVGIFDGVVGYYTERGAEKSGRIDLWTVGLNTFMESWWSGVGISNSHITLPVGGEKTTSHNGLLFIGLQSGIIPLVFFVWYWARAGLRAFHARDQQSRDAPYRLPLYLFASFEMMSLSAVFMDPWMMVVITIAMAAGQTSRGQKKPRGVPSDSIPVGSTKVS